jgi:hypothetical protein
MFEKIPNGNRDYVAFALPARNRTKHVWHFWAQVKKKLSTEHTARAEMLHSHDFSFLEARSLILLPAKNNDKSIPKGSYIVRYF